MSEPWKCPDCGTWLAPRVSEHRCDPPQGGTAATRIFPPGPAGLNVTMTPVARGPCDHAHAETGYHPSRTLAHLIRARIATCTAPGCKSTSRSRSVTELPPKRSPRSWRSPLSWACTR